MDVAFQTIGSLSLELAPASSFVADVGGMTLTAEAFSPAKFTVNPMAIPGPRGPVGPLADVNEADNVVDPTAYYILAKS